MKIADSPERALEDWLRREGIKLLPAVNWVERGRLGDGNRLPRYHVIWGTAREPVRCLLEALHRENSAGKLTLLHQHRITALDHEAGKVCSAVAINEASGSEVRLTFPAVVLATGDINGSHRECRADWPVARPQPARFFHYYPL
ncbi:FAD-binding protein [Marinobacter vulgaris]|uniref:FAD-binding protein n=1 Tax=Marinobacter vulgaris TaxID=1928331 RepID=UPI00222867BC|nr:FAD-binding protein [Marinobacter vulgaris]